MGSDGKPDRLAAGSCCCETYRERGLQMRRRGHERASVPIESYCSTRSGCKTRTKLILRDCSGSVNLVSKDEERDLREGKEPISTSEGKRGPHT